MKKFIKNIASLMLAIWLPAGIIFALSKLNS
jgi:hypothetical protein